MLPIFESLLPVFLLIALGFLLKRISLIADDHWAGMERIGFYVLFPALLISILSRTDFYALPSGAIVTSVLLALGTILVVGLVIRVPVQRALAVSRSSYSSIYQGFGRWNAFIALGIVEKLIGPEGLAIVAIVISVAVIPTVLVNVSVVGWLGNREPGNSGKLFRMIAFNPLIIGALIGLSLSLFEIPVYQPVAETLDLVARMTLPLGLILVGTGLRVRMPKAMLTASLFGTFMKLLVVPAVYVGFGWWLGLNAQTLVILGICGGVPSAMNGYLIAREMGGDAPLYAAIVTLQTVLAFFTLPLIILGVGYFAG